MQNTILIAEREKGYEGYDGTRCMRMKYAHEENQLAGEYAEKRCKLLFGISKQTDRQTGYMTIVQGAYVNPNDRSKPVALHHH